MRYLGRHLTDIVCINVTQTTRWLDVKIT